MYRTDKVSGLNELVCSVVGSGVKIKYAMTGIMIYFNINIVQGGKRPLWCHPVRFCTTSNENCTFFHHNIKMAFDLTIKFERKSIAIEKL